MAARTRQLENATLTIRVANEASWGDLQKVLSSTAPAGGSHGLAARRTGPTTQSGR
jgi:hypothetical protein